MSHFSWYQWTIILASRKIRLVFDQYEWKLNCHRDLQCRSPMPNLSIWSFEFYPHSVFECFALFCQEAAIIFLKQHSAIGLCLVMLCVFCELKTEFYVFICMSLVFKTVNPFNYDIYKKKRRTVQLFQATTNTFVLIDNRRKATEIAIAQLVCTFIILFTLYCMFLLSWKSVDSKVENKSDTIYRN
jgi:hypothetical protein